MAPTLSSVSIYALALVSQTIFILLPSELFSLNAILNLQEVGRVHPHDFGIVAVQAVRVIAQLKHQLQLAPSIPSLDPASP